MKVIFIYETKNAKKIENCVLAQIKDLRYKKRKDFYEMSFNLLKKIIKSCSDLTLKYKKSIQHNIKSIQEGGNGINKLYLYMSY